jgi:anaerobic magnesium-protoporphyrin IX monomethyl ester cyclase
MGYDAICISQSEIVRYEQYSKLPLTRLNIYKDLVQLRFAYLDGAFRGHLDILNKALYGKFALGNQSPEMLNIWNLPGLNGILLASYMKTEGLNLGIINFFDAGWNDFVRMYQESSNPLVIISTTFHLSYAEIARMIKKLKNFDPNIKVAVGGPFINERFINAGIDSFAESMQKYQIDYLIHSFNGERDLLALIKAHRTGSDLEQVGNLVYRDGDNYKSTKVSWNEPSLNTHQIQWSNLDLPFLNKTVQLRTAVSCPFSCAFCSYPRTAGKHITSELEYVDMQLAAISKIPGIEQVIFIDDTFNVPTPRFREMLKVIGKYNLRWYSFVRTQYVDDETARMMKESGCESVYLGIESFDDKVLVNMNKKVTQKQYLSGIASMKKHGISMFAALVLGFPGETKETLQYSAKILDESGIDFYSLKLFYYMPHTMVHDKRQSFGLTGMGNKWQHDTMTSDEAYNLSLEMFDTIKNPIYVDADTSLWYIAYLRDRGFSMEQIRKSQMLMNAMMKQDNNADFYSKDQLMQQLSTVVSSIVKPQSKAPLCANSSA